MEERKRRKTDAQKKKIMSLRARKVNLRGNLGGERNRRTSGTELRKRGSGRDGGQEPSNLRRPRFANVIGKEEKKKYSRLGGSKHLGNPQFAKCDQAFKEKKLREQGIKGKDPLTKEVKSNIRIWGKTKFPPH